MNTAPANDGACPPFYFICVFWGGRYWREFCRLCLASMLAPGNIPALDGAIRAASRFVIVTTKVDWAALQDDPTFVLMKRYIEPLFIELPRPGADDNKMKIMSQGHALASEAAFRARACGVYLTPDLVLSDGSVVALQRLSRAGKKVVLCVAVRFTEEGCLPELEALGVMQPGAPMVLPARTLVGVALRNIHSETQQWEWKRSFFAKIPICPYWQVPGEEGIVMHSFSWAPLLVDYSALAEHDASTFEEWTLDGDYVHRNFGDHADEAIHVVTDSDEITLVSFTREADLHYDHKSHWATSVPFIAPLTKLALVRNLYHSTTMDDLKRRIFDRAVRLHGGELNNAWKNTEKHAARRIAVATKGLAAQDTAIPLLIRLSRVIALDAGGFFAKIIIYGAPLYFRILRQAILAKANSKYVLVKSYLTIGYTRHLYATYRGRIHNRILLLRSRYINACARGRNVAQSLKASHLIPMVRKFRRIRIESGHDAGD